MKTIFIERDSSRKVTDMASVHAHPYHELYFLLSGERRYLIGHHLYDVLPGDIVIIPKTQLHRTTALNNKGYERYVVYFLDDDISGFIDRIGKEAFESFMSSGCLQLPQEHIMQIQQNLHKMAHEQKKNDLLSQHLIINLLENIILNTMRYGKKKTVEQGKSTSKLQAVMRYISENYTSDITLQDAADIAFMERTYFSRCFKHVAGVGFNEYLTQIRLRTSEQLLQFSDLSISDISDRCGFSSSNYFCDVFKRSHNGIPPSEYRKKAGHLLPDMLPIE
ncbi:MAG: AraC family transcriptional regulator [Oscillospiraceae bacterium]|nr:AraC family transcriptional regulator [Oscillospiraceae bacterium]